MTLDDIVAAIGIEPYYRDKWAVIYHADCRDILPLIPDKSVELVLTDPPYGLNSKMQGGTWGIKFNTSDMLKWDYLIPDDFMQVLVDKYPCVIWGANNYCLPPSRGWLIWHKRDAVKTMSACELAWTNLDQPIQFFDHPIAATNAERNGHPTLKPLALMKWCLTFYPKSNLILDPFMGSGTTLVAAKTLNRYSIGIEIEERYCKIAADRLRQSVMELNI